MFTPSFSIIIPYYNQTILSPVQYIAIWYNRNIEFSWGKKIRLQKWTFPWNQIPNFQKSILLKLAFNTVYNKMLTLDPNQETFTLTGLQRSNRAHHMNFVYPQWNASLSHIIPPYQGSREDSLSQWDTLLGWQEFLTQCMCRSPAIQEIDATTLFKSGAHLHFAILHRRDFSLKLSAKNLFRILHSPITKSSQLVYNSWHFYLFFPVSNICISKILSWRVSLKHLLLLTYMSAICVCRFIYLHLVVFFLFPYISKSYHNNSFHSKFTLTLT